jgi:transposase InsO family protein
MDERVLFVADYVRELYDFTELCARYGVSRKTGYKWVERYRHEGTEGLQERSRRPLSQPTQLPYAVQQAIIQLRGSRRMELGPKKIQTRLRERFPDQTVPSRTTIYNVLKRAGLITPRRLRRRVAPSGGVLDGIQVPNGLWSADFKGQFITGDRHWCYPLTVMDHASRYLLGCHALPGTRGAETRTSFERLFRRYGLPERLRTDNGVPFASLGSAGLSRLSIWWIRLGIVPERIKPGQPQQNGRHERMHRTLKRAAAQPPAPNARAQQRRFDVFRRHYNAERPHEALAQRTPASVYTLSPRPYPERLPEMIYPSYMHAHRVCDTGLIYWNAWRIYVGYLLAGEHVGIEPVGDGLWNVHFGPIRLGGFDERNLKPEEDYLTLKL